MQSKTTIGIKGFTLLEVLISIAIFAAIVAVIYPSYTGTFRNIEHAESEAEIYQMARITLDRIMEDFKSAYLSDSAKDENFEDDFFRPIGFLGQDDVIDGRSADTARFISGEHLTFDDMEKTGKARIRFYVKENVDEGNGFILYRSDTYEFEESPEEGTSGLVLCTDLHSIDLTYYNEDGDTYDYWDSSVEPFKGKLPSRVSIKLGFNNRSDPESPIMFMTSVSLPLARSKYGKGS